MGKYVVYVANRLWLIVLIYVVSIGFSSYLFSLIEGKTLEEAAWWSIVTSLTIGYGDVVPHTSLGKLVGVFFGIFWIFVIIPMIVANVIMKLIENKNEFTDSEQKELFNLVKSIESSIKKDVE